MSDWIKKYWAEILALGVVGSIMMICLAPSITWHNTDSDGAHYILAAKYLTTAHHMSAPLYLLLGRLFLFLPFGTEAWRMGLMSALGGFGCAIFIYLIVRELLIQWMLDNISKGREWVYISENRARIYAIVATLVFGGSALIISQSTIIETYMLSTMCGVGAYYFALKKRWVIASVMLGAGMAIHPFLSFIAWAVLFFAFKEMRHWKRFGITVLFFAFYAYLPIVAQVNPNNDMWGNETASGFFGGTLGMVIMHTGGISMYDMPQRIINTLLILVACFGVGIVPLVYYFIKERTLKKSLLWLTLIPILYFVLDLANEVYVYMVVGIAFGAIAVGLGLSRMNYKWTLATLAVAIGLMGFNCNYFDLGRTLDSELSAMKYYNEELPKIPDGEYFMGGGWTWAMVYLYNREEGRNIIPISIDALPDPYYQETLSERGIKYRKMEENSYITRQGELALSVAEMNDHVWIAKETIPEEYRYEIVPAKGEEDYIGRWIGQEIEPEIRWKPSNPWKFISGELEVREWHHILWSSHNAFYVISLALIGYAVVWWVFVWINSMREKKKKMEVV